MLARLQIICVSALLFIVACTSSGSDFGNDQSSLEKNDFNFVSVDFGESITITPFASPIPTQTATAISLLPSEEVEFVTSTPTPASRLQQCSPLKMHALESLPSIISGPYDPPPMGKDDRHHGVDFAYWIFGERTTMQGELVQSILPGVVRMVLDDRFPYGYTVMVETQTADLSPSLITSLGFEQGESLYTLYAHLDFYPLVELGEVVEACQQIGEVGLSGNTDIAHLHLETRIGPSGTIFESMMFYSTRATISEMENYRLWRTSGVFRHFDPMTLLLTDLP
jgi:murein DD-endopeptidase MepM/ murein hydrolase activator NlpD